MYYSNYGFNDFNKIEKKKELPLPSTVYYFAYGSNMKKGEKFTKKIMLWDICPTIMHMFDIPIPSYMDGKPLKEIFHSESPYQSKNLEFVEQKIEDVIKSSGDSYTDEQEKEIEKNLSQNSENNVIEDTDYKQKDNNITTTD